MTREEAIYWIENLSGSWDGQYREARDMAISALREQPRWISVEERLPKYGERVLITEGHAVFEASLSISHKWVRCGIGWAEGVTHWMPLPEPPKEEV